jgi:hypothetical protein
MEPPTYLYVVTVCRPESTNPWSRQNNPEAICRTKEEAEFLEEELKKLVITGEPLITTICRVPFLETAEQFKEILS